MKKLLTWAILFSSIGASASLGLMTRMPIESKKKELKKSTVKSDKVKTKASSTRKKIQQDEKEERRNYLNIKNYNDRPNE